VTGRDLVSAALRKIGVLASEETPSNSEATDGLAELNRMLGSWSNERLLIPAVVREEFSLTAGDQTYTLGATGADFTTSRPVNVDRATIEDQTASPAAEYPVDILTPQQWAAIAQKETGNSVPTKLYVEGTYPNATLHLYPKPQGNLKLVLYSEKPLSTIALNDTLALQPGAEDALVCNLAKRLAPEYGKLISDDLRIDARDTKAALKTANHRPRFLYGDPALSSGGRLNIYTGRPE
jgi:hypothetical protein